MDIRLQVFRTILQPMRPGRLLDLGCGHGKFSIMAQQMGWDVTAVDARTTRMPMTEGINWIRSDVREFEIGDYDCICVLGLLYHLELDDQLDLLRRTSRSFTILDTHVALEAKTTQGGYEGSIFAELPTPEEKTLAETPTAAWGNLEAFWPTQESLYRMLEKSGYSSIFTLSPPYQRDRTFYLCHP